MKSIAEIFSSYEVLDEHGRHVNGTDKNGPNHRYGDAYERLFEFNDTVYGRYSIRPSIKLMMEVGIADGSSLCAWRDIFSSALCVGLDIHHSDKAHGERIEFHRGDATVQRDCEEAAAGRQFDFICEDATHLLQDSLLTLLYLWPYVRPGGLYVIEEFSNVGALRRNIVALWPYAEIIDTNGPFGGVEPLVVLRKPYES